jgi:hypothetical protein
VQVSVNIALAQLEETLGIQRNNLSLAHFFNRPEGSPQRLLEACDSELLFRLHREAVTEICMFEQQQSGRSFMPMPALAADQKREHLAGMFEEIVYVMYRRGMKATYRDLELPQWAKEIEEDAN